MRAKGISIQLAALLAFLVASLAAAQAETIEEKAQVCTACHGENGVPPAQQFPVPVIWGQNLGYLFFQLRDFKSGARKNDQMTPIAQSLEQSDLMPLAQYFSKKPWPNLQQPKPPADVLTRAQRANNPSSAPAAIRRDSRARARSRGLPGSSTPIWKGRCSISAPAPAATIPACRT